MTQEKLYIDRLKALAASHYTAKEHEEDIRRAERRKFQLREINISMFARGIGAQCAEIYAKERMGK